MGKLPSRPLGKGMDWDLFRQTKSKGVSSTYRSGEIETARFNIFARTRRETKERGPFLEETGKMHLARYGEALVVIPT